MTPPDEAWNDSLDDAFKFAAHLLAVDALHIKTNRRLQSLSQTEVFDHLKAEVQELIDDPDDMYEWADCFAILAHHAARMRWSHKELAHAVRYKLRLRFDIPPLEIS